MARTAFPQTEGPLPTGRAFLSLRRLFYHKIFPRASSPALFSSQNRPERPGRSLLMRVFPQGQPPRGFPTQTPGLSGRPSVPPHRSPARRKSSAQSHEPPGIPERLEARSLLRSLVLPSAPQRRPRRVETNFFKTHRRSAVPHDPLTADPPLSKSRPFASPDNAQRQPPNRTENRILPIVAFPRTPPLPNANHRLVSFSETHGGAVRSARNAARPTPPNLAGSRCPSAKSGFS